MGNVFFDYFLIVDVLQETPDLVSINAAGDIAKRLSKLGQEPIDVLDLKTCQINVVLIKILI